MVAAVVVPVVVVVEVVVVETEASGREARRERSCVVRRVFWRSSDASWVCRAGRAAGRAAGEAAMAGGRAGGRTCVLWREGGNRGRELVAPGSAMFTRETRGSLFPAGLAWLQLDAGAGQGQGLDLT